MIDNNVIPIWKNTGITSYDVIRKVKKKIGNIKIGHCGTLDPFAEGVLILCLGDKTKDISMFADYEKEYIATIFLGEETDTLDTTGEIIYKKNIPKIDTDIIEKAIQSFQGEILQIPPYFSALKFKGMKLYEFARKDIFIRKKARIVTITDIKLLDIEDNKLKLYIKCKKGTYVRSLARDIAYKLNTVGYLTDLKRIAIGPYNEDNTLKIEEIKNVQAS